MLECTKYANHIDLGAIYSHSVRYIIKTNILPYFFQLCCTTSIIIRVCRTMKVCFFFFLLSFFSDKIYIIYIIVMFLKIQQNNDIIQLMTFDEVNTKIDQPMEHDIHRGIRCEYHVPCVDRSLYSPKWKVINCFII